MGLGHRRITAQGLWLRTVLALDLGDGGNVSGTEGQGGRGQANDDDEPHQEAVRLEAEHACVFLSSSIGTGPRAKEMGVTMHKWYR